MSQLSLQARIFGKEGSLVKMENTRVIMPLPSILNLIDSILPVILEPFIDRVFPVPPGVWIGARKKTQTLETSHGLSLVIEKSLDLESVGAVGQSDVRAFFDSVHLLRVFECLVRKGLCRVVAAACIRQQLCCNIRIHIGSSCAVIGERCIGSLTGSRLAGMAARVPIMDLCTSRGGFWERDGFYTPSGIITMSTFVDNLFAAGRSCAAVSRILDDAEDYLSTEWGLHIKPSSRAILVPDHCSDVSTNDDEKWPVVLKMKVLGHWLQRDGGVDQCFNDMLKCIWKAFFANCVGAELSRLLVKARITLLLPSVVPILRLKWTRWPFTISKALHWMLYNAE